MWPLEVLIIRFEIWCFPATNFVTFCLGKLDNFSVSHAEIVDIGIDWVYRRAIADVAYHRLLDITHGG